MPLLGFKHGWKLGLGMGQNIEKPILGVILGLFETLRREIKADVRKQHNLYANNLVGDCQANPRGFYQYIISQKKDTQGIPPLKRKNGKGVAQLDLEKAEEFNGQFTDVLNKNEHTQVPLLDRSAPFMNDIVISKDIVIKLLKGLNPHFRAWWTSS